MTYLYDGSFEGFLTLIHDSYIHKRVASKIVKNPLDIDLLDDVYTIITNKTYAMRVLEGLKNKFKKENFERIFQTFLCDSQDFEKPLYDYILLGFRDQKNLEDILHPSILYLENLHLAYFRYLHKMYGFVRFEELEDGVLYARVKGRFNILPYLGKHFIKRLDGFDFIIHDMARSLAYISIDGKGKINEVKDFDLPVYSKEEIKFQKLWKTFLKSVTISERKNLKLQQTWIPLLYREYMLEFNHNPQ